MAAKAYTLGDLIAKHLTQKKVVSDKEITLRVLGGESYIKIAEELDEKTEEEIRQIVLSTCRKACKNSGYPTEAAYTEKQWKEIVESGISDSYEKQEEKKAQKKKK